MKLTCIPQNELGVRISQGKGLLSNQRTRASSGDPAGPLLPVFYASDLTLSLLGIISPLFSPLNLILVVDNGFGNSSHCAGLHGPNSRNVASTFHLQSLMRALYLTAASLRSPRDVLNSQAFRADAGATMAPFAECPEVDTHSLITFPWV